jgi:mycoredoxin
VPNPTPAGSSASAESAESLQFTVYSTPWCGYCTRLKRQLKGEGVAFAEVDIELEPEAEAIVKAANGGNATVPTLVFADGSSLTNPTLREVLAKLETAA